MLTSLNIEVNENNVECGAKEIISTLKPDWKPDDVVFKMFTEGITNKLMACRHKDDIEKENVLLIRVYGLKTDIIIDRDLELQNMHLMYKNGSAQQVYAKFRNGIVYGYIDGECLDEKTVRDTNMARLIAKEMVRMHSIDPEKENEENSTTFKKSPCIFPKIKKYINLIPSEFQEPERNERFKKDIMSKEDLHKEVEFLRTELEGLGSPVVFCHNDLLLKNIVYSKKKDRTYFIDFEYGAFNYEAYELGNHFCEFAGIDTVDFNLYPDKAFQQGWLRFFLEEKYKSEGRNPTDVTETDVERLYVQTNKFTLLAHFFWAVWALIQAKYSTIDFDYLDYAVVRFNEYFAKKEQFLALRMP